MSRPIAPFVSVCVLFAALLWAVPGGAQQATTGGNSPLQINADNGIEWRRDEQVYIARGNAVAQREDLSVSADRLLAYYREVAGETEFYRIEAHGNVEVVLPEDVAYGDQGIYYSDRKVAVLTGDDLRLDMADGSVVRARDSLEYWEDFEGRPVAVARGDASMQSDEDLIEADTLTASFTEDVQGERVLDRVDAIGNVRIRTPNEFAVGNEGIYYAIDDRAVLAGDVKITQGPNQLNGDRAEVDFETGISRLLPGSGTRVQGLLVPQSSDDGAEGDE